MMVLDGFRCRQRIILLGLAYFPLRVGFRFDPQPCEFISSAKYVLLSFTNHGHIGRFAVFFAMSAAQVRKGLRPATSGFVFASIAGLQRTIFVRH